MKDFFKTFSPVVDEKLVNAGTSDGVKKSWETRKGNRIGGDGADKDYPKNPHNFSKPVSENNTLEYHRAAGSAAALSSLAQQSGEPLNHQMAMKEHLKAAGLADKMGDKNQGDYHRSMILKHAEDTGMVGRNPQTSYGKAHKEFYINELLKNSSDRLLNSVFTNGVKLTVGELNLRLVNALATCDKMKNSSIQDILCPDETGHWAVVLNDRKCFFTLKDGQPLLNWEHKEKSEKAYEPWDEEPKVEGGWDEDLLGDGSGGE